MFGVDLGLLIVESSYESYACKRWNRAFQMMIGILFWNAGSFSHEEVCQCEHGVKWGLGFACMTTLKRGYPDGFNHFSEIACFLYGCAKTQAMAFQGEKQIMEAFSNKGFPRTPILSTTCSLWPFSPFRIGPKILKGSAPNSVSCMHAYPIWSGTASDLSSKSQLKISCSLSGRGY